VKFWQEVDGLLLRQAAKYADAIRAAFIRSINVADIVERWTQAYPAGGLVSAAEARQWARQNIPVQRKPLADIIEHIYATGWVMGQDVSTAAYAHAQLGIKKAAPTAKDLKYALNIDWGKWKPGNKPAALLVRPSGKFSQLLEQGRVSIKGMNDTTLDRVGTLLADTLESGAGYSELARSLLKDQITSRVVTDASRAGTIAVTEMSRALNTATVDNYKEFGVEKVEWLAIDTGVCDICPANEAQGPIPIGQMFESGDTEPPAHPNCRCTVVPVVDEGPEMTDEQFAQAIMDGDAPAISEGTLPSESETLPTLTEERYNFPEELIGRYDPNAYDIDENIVPDENAMRRWADKAQGDYGRFLVKDPNFSEAFIDYMTEGYYDALNVALREGVELSDDFYKTASSIYQAIYNESATFLDDLPLYRGIEDSKNFFGSLKVGDTFMDNGIISTSTNPLVSESFSVKYNSGTPYMLQIILPKGYNGLALDPIADTFGGSDIGAGMKEITGFEYLNEVLLPPGTKFEVTEIDDATKTIQMKVVGQENAI
jgi:SPP1 gp7 family putative phage head morphogenesis protein